MSRPINKAVFVFKFQGRLAAITPRNAEWVERAKDLGGKWQDQFRAWTFPEAQEREVWAELKEIYGGDAQELESARVELKALEARIKELKGQFGEAL